MKLTVHRGDMKINLDCKTGVVPEQELFSSSGREYPSQKLPSPTLMGVSASRAIWTFKNVLCVCVWCYLHTAYYKWIFFLYSKWGVGRNISNNSSHTALFHPREERGVSLLNCKKKVSMQLKFSPCTRETASAQPAVPATTERSLIYPTDLYSRSSWGMEVKLWNNQE